MANPFKIGSTSYDDFEKMSDLKWHCSKCELKSGQAKTWQVWRQSGLQLRKDDKGNWYKKIACPICNNQTIHRSLESLEISDNTVNRSGIPQKLSKRIKEILKNEEAVFLRKLISNELEIDHKFPQIRWSTNEDKNLNEMSEAEIKRKFILLNRSNNLLKSRNCEKCFKTGKRGNFPGIYFWYKGDEEWPKDCEPTNESGCVGCYWHNPYSWREELNNLINNDGK